MDIVESRGQRPLIFPFLLISYIWTGGIIAVVIRLTGVGSDPASFPPWIYALVFAAGFGPSLAAFVLVRPAGRRGEFKSRLSRAPSSYRWLLVPPLFIGAVAAATWGVNRALGISVVDGPSMLRILPLALIWPVFSSLGEEFGWRGFLLPVLRERYRPVTASLFVGVFWGLWHIPALWLVLGNSGSSFWVYVLIGGILAAVVHSVMMTWVYEKTGGSLLLMIWFHYWITAAAILFGKPDLPFREGIVHASTSIGFGGLLVLIILALDGREGRSMSG